jgi:hypothetical protein
MTKLSPQAQTVWEAFNADEAGVFVDYGEKLAAALRAAADQVEQKWQGLGHEACQEIRAIAAELKAQ